MWQLMDGDKDVSMSMTPIMSKYYSNYVPLAICRKLKVKFRTMDTQQERAVNLAYESRFMEVFVRRKRAFSHSQVG